MSTRRLALALAVLILIAVGGLAVSARSQPPTPPTPGVPVEKVDICHKPPSNGGRSSVSVSSIFSGQGHDLDETDIIPPFTYVENGVTKTYPGKNWDLQGQATWFYDCNPANVPKVTPTLLCVETRSDGLLAHFGYTNDENSTANIPVSLVNMFVPSPENRGQPVAFATGTHTDVFQVEFTGSLEWRLAGKSVTASSDSPRCQASIRIDKAVAPNPDTDPGRFDLLLDATALASNVRNGGSTGIHAVTAAPGGTQFTVSERATPGTSTNLGDYDSAIVCRDNAGSGTTVAHGEGTSLAVTVRAGQAIVCVITNIRRTATIRIDKVVVPDTDPGLFDLLLDGTAHATGVGNGGTTNAIQVTPAAGGTQFTVSEQGTEGTNTNLDDYDTTIVCSNGRARAAPRNGTSLTLTVTAGQAVVCTITNTRISPEPGSATIRIDKVVVAPDPGADPGQFDLLLDGTVHATAVGNGGTTNAIPVTAAAGGTQYTVSEQATPGTNTNLADYATAILCRSNGAPVAEGTGTSLNVTVTAGQAIVCTITNTRNPPLPGSATIRIDKVVVAPDPAADPGRFDLLLDGAVKATGVGDGGTTNAIQVTPAAGGTQYTVSERATPGTGTNPDDYDTTIACGNGRARAAPRNGTSLTVTVTAGQAIVCTITNTRRSEQADLKVIKTARPRSLPVGQQVTWTVTVTNKGPATATNVVVDDSLPDDMSYVGGSLDVPPEVTCVGTRCTLDSLAAGDSVTGRFVTTATAVGRKTNIVTVSADQDDPTPGDNAASAQVLVTGEVEEDVRPILECVEPLSGGSYRAHFGYLNTGNDPVPVPVGPRNAFTPAPEDRGQPVEFQPGRAPDVFQVDFQRTITWTLTTHTAVASADSKRCASRSGTLRIDKILQPSDDPGRFDLEIDGVPAGTGRGVGHLGTTGDVAVTAGRHRVGEEGAGGTSLANYDTTIVCRGGAGLGRPTSAFEGPEVLVDVPAGDSVVCTIVNKRRATPSPEPPPAPPPDPTPPPTPPPATADLAVRKAVDRNLASLGDVVTWTVLVVNNGPETATGVTITDAAAARAKFVSLTVSQGTCANISCSLGTIPHGRTVRIVARTRALETGVTLNTVVVKGDQPDTIPENNVASALLRVVSAFRPPLEQRCGSLSVNRRLAVAGTRVPVRAVVKNVFGRPLVGTLVSAQGAGQQSAARTNPRGVAVLRLAPSKAGLVRITVSARTLTAAQAPRCSSLLAVRRASGGGVSGGQTGKPGHGKPHFTG